MPRTGPATGLPEDRIDAFVEVDGPIQEYSHQPVGPAAEAIASTSHASSQMAPRCRSASVGCRTRCCATCRADATCPSTATS
jgi:hypothetical protein